MGLYWLTSVSERTAVQVLTQVNLHFLGILLECHLDSDRGLDFQSFIGKSRNELSNMVEKINHRLWGEKFRRLYFW